MSPSSRRVALLAPLLLLAVAASTGIWLSARPAESAFTDVEEVGANRLGSARLDLAIGSSSVAIDAENVAPGDRLDGTIVLDNDGDLPLRYSMVATVDGVDLAPWVTWWLGRPNAGGCAEAAPLSAPLSIEHGATVELVGGPPEDLPSVAPAGSRSLCLIADVDLESPNAVQSSRIDLVIDIFAEHDLDAESRAAPA